MKKLVFVFLFISTSTLFSQTVLTSYALDLKNAELSGQIINAANKVTNDLFAFVADRENVTILKYNQFLFLTDQFTTTRIKQPENEMVGYSFGEDGNPTLYWASEGSKNIILTKYFLDTKTSKSLNFKLPVEEQFVITHFQKNNFFYLLAQEKNEQGLVLYVFKNEACEAKSLDFSTFTFQDKSTKQVTLNQILRKYPIEKIDLDFINPLFVSNQKSKLYVLNDRLILTLDHNFRRTQVFDINLETLAITEKKFPQSADPKTMTTSNSFFSDNKLFQMNVTENELLFDVKDYHSNETLKSIKIDQNDTLYFKKVPFLFQKNESQPKKFKSTKKFLKSLPYMNTGLSVFKNYQNTYITIGGYLNTYQSNNPLFLNDGPFFFPESSYSMNTETAYFEGMVNASLDLIQQETQPLAIDNIFYFLNMHKEVAAQNIIKFKDYYILGYYDRITKQYIMRKFTDGFYYEERNPIINKASLSNPYQFETLKFSKD
ncbi:hypothetical protein AAEO57_17500 [Flavobacterium sp. DGU38]|uniref:6-bladed beta-propeller protein n=1 Tax=Flavobacterium calami TaxID=3139144 RepID=A0ABU9IT47_9FLAO